MNKFLVSAAIVGVAAAVSTSAKAEINCYGIAKAGQNDCPAYDGSHSCAGQAQRSYLPVDWIYADDSEACKRKCGSPNQPGTPDPQFCNSAAANQPGAGQGGNTIMPVDPGKNYIMPVN